MDTQTFIDAVKAFEGLTPEMVEHLTGLAESLTDDQRASAIKELTDANSMIEDGKAEMQKVQDAGDAKMEQIKKEDLPKLRKDAEDAEHSSDLGDAEAQLSNS